jgi:hypothetical protein
MTSRLFDGFYAGPVGSKNLLRRNSLTNAR